MNIVKEFTEEELVDQIRFDIGKYFEMIQREGYIKCPDRLTQGFENMDAFCGDLVAAYQDFGALVLEVKVRASTTAGQFLPSYEEDQHLGLKILQSANVPVYFAYNEAGRASFVKNEVKANLSRIRAPKPDELDIVINPGTGRPYTKGKLNLVNGHTLLEILEDGSRRPVENVCAALYFTFKAHEALLNSGIGSLSTKILVCIYHRHMNRFALLDAPKARALMQRIRDETFIASAKGGRDFARQVEGISRMIEREFAQIIADLPALDEEDDEHQHGGAPVP